MRSPLKPLLIAAILVAASLAASRPALAQCEFACTNVEDPSGQGQFCQRCLFWGPGSGDCQDVGECGCFDVQCYDGLSAEETLRIDLGIAPAPKVQQCADRTESKPALHLRFLPART
jgi:hypothetical protein